MFSNPLKKIAFLILSLLVVTHFAFADKADNNQSVNAKSASTASATVTGAATTPLSTKKQAFVNRVLPGAKAINQKLKSTRTTLLSYQKTWNASGTLPANEKAWLKTTATHFKMSDFDINKADDWAKLIKRVDIVPLSLVVAQSATESGWGSSRIAKQANNFFGYECFSKSCGLAPVKAPKSYYEYRKFASLQTGIHEYMRNLNTHPAYQQLRDIRANLRAGDKTIKGTSLANGLTRYSSRGQAYVTQVKTMITKNKWQSLDNA